MAKTQRRSESDPTALWCEGGRGRRPPAEQPPALDQYQGGGDLACVTLLGPDASPAELQDQSQAILEEDPGDPNGLDADGDGVACEFSETPTGELAFEDGSGYVSDGVRVDAEDGGPVPGGADQTRYGEDLACVTVLGPEASPEKLRKEAQSIYDADPADPNNLDAGGNGLACEFSEDASGEILFEDGSGFVTDLAQYQETPEPEAPAPVPGGTVTDEAAAKKPSNLPARASAPTKTSALRELPATGGAPLLPISGGPATAGTALVGTALLLAARRRPPGV